MIPRGLEGLRQSGEDTLAVVMHQRDLAVHQRRRPHDAASEDLADALVAEAHAEQRAGPAEAGDQLTAHAGVLRAPRAG